MEIRHCIELIDCGKAISISTGDGSYSFVIEMNDGNTTSRVFVPKVMMNRFISALVAVSKQSRINKIGE